MKKRFFNIRFLFFVLIIFSLRIFSQIPATTYDGKKVILYSNNYWENAENKNELSYYYPALNKNDYLIQHHYYSLVYDTLHFLAKWTIYELKKEYLQSKVAERKNKFQADPYLPQLTQLDFVYKNSGYDKGHLVPAADMTFSELAMNESFYYTNVAPQLPSFNRGIWKKLEEQVRAWAMKHNNLIVLSGAFISDTLQKLSKVSVPYYFYKIIAMITPSQTQMIAFIIPNEKSFLPLKHCVVSVDSIEKVTHINFFPSLNDNVEEQVEKKVDINFWWDER
ncbi:MAG: DNA/RNA non-specific endonuclease [Bacteroidota bacterium]